MKKSWKVGLVSSLVLTPAAIALTEQPVVAQSADEQRAIEYFTKLHLGSSMADYALYKEILAKAFPNDEANAKYKLMLEKLNYIKTYNEQKLIADSLKSEISKLTLTNKTLVQNYKEANEKYNALLSKLEEINLSLAAAKGNVTDTAYDEMLKNIESSYKKLATELTADLIGNANQNVLYVRGTQITNVTKAAQGEKNYLELVEAIYKATTKADYDTYIPKANAKYATFTTDEKTIADNQLINGTTLTMKQAMTAANDNLAKAKAFDQTVSKLASIQLDNSQEDSITALKTQLIAIDKAYNALTPFQKKLINDNSEKVIAPFQQILAISGEIGALKPDNTQNYRNAVTKIGEDIDALIEQGAIDIKDVISISGDNLEKIIPNIEMYEKAIADIKAVQDIEKQIEQLMGTEEAPANPTKEDIDKVRDIYNKLTADQKKIVMNSSFITGQEDAKKSGAAVDKKIEAITISAKADFYKRYKAAQDAYDELDKAVASIYVTKKGRLDALAPYAELVNKFLQLKVTDADYKTNLDALIIELNKLEKPDDLSALVAEEKAQLKSVINVLSNQDDVTKIASQLVINIDQLDELAKQEPKKLIETVIEYRELYNTLDSTTKKLVTNIKKLTEYEKANKKALSVMKLIDRLDPLDSKFVKYAVSARKAYDKLSPNLQALIGPSFEELVELEKISSVMLEIDNLKKSRDILGDTTNAKKSYDNLKEYLQQKGDETDVLALLEQEYAPKLKLAEERHEDVSELVNQINALTTNTTENIGADIKTIATSYKALSSSDKKLVGNYSDFKAIEKDYKAALKVYNLIEELPKKEADNYTKKVEAALKAYNKLTDAQTKYVFNYEEKLLPVIGVASLIGDIDSIKTSMKDFASFISKLRARYDALSPAEQAQVHNYKKLEAAEQSLNGATHVIQLIQAARPGVENYLDALQKARDAYDLLSSDQKKQVTNYKELQNREKSLKPILDLNDLILKIGLQSTAKKFISNYDKAWKELDKVSLQDRALLTNQKLLTETYVPLYNVMKGIESIKASSKTFVDDVKAARAAYDALSADQKAKILNEDLLREHERNVDGGAGVDALIRALKSNPPAVYVQKVLEAEEAYKNLSSANKKAVTLYDELKVELKYIAPVVQAIEAIDLLATSGGKLDAQVKKVNSILAKLTDEQYALIPNMAKYNNLGNVIQVVGLIDLIKPSDTKYYIGNTKAAEIAYNRLSPEEKQKVTNFGKLEEALLNVSALDQITKKISELSNLSSTYVDDVNNLLAEYKKLPSALKKQVSNYSVLERAEKDINAADKVIRAIEAIDPKVRTFESKVIAARKQYDKLTDDQKTLVTNMRLLLQHERELGL